ncbi:FAD-binding oxidoreductase [Marinoscillum sp. MHG1-6]|uniref:NAD(P)/FAD-dependent oxidoreductase n=1 Tax=Marinoscillum sp. MHG1-6 TaxID=2959627 RepID=UPI002157EE68|nr:FAD-dependent oxidoreductase [Marinoscillum sp. MHG1-6]
MISLWEKESFISFDIIIVGAGITGFSTAASLKEKHPELKVLILERGLIPTGASTRNAGFACFGSVSELLNDRHTLGEEGMVELVEKRWKGLQMMIERLGANTIDLEKKGGYELITESQEFLLDKIEDTNELIRPIFGQPVFHKKDDQISPFGLRRVKHLIYNEFEAQLHSGKLLHSLWQYCSRLGVQVITGAEVTHFENQDNFIEVRTNSLNFQGKNLTICTNAFSNKFITSNIDLKPGRGLVMYVKPTKKLQFEGTFHYDEGYNYFRDFKGGIILGGGRNLALEEEETTEFGTNERILNHLEMLLQEMIIPDQEYSIEQTWSGIMAFGATKSPIIQKIDQNCFIGIRLGGMGVAIGSMVGEELSERILESGL